MKKSSFRLARLAGFFGDTRGALAASSVLVSFLCLTSVAFIADHALLIHHRDVLQAATDSASLVATQQMQELVQEDPDQSEESLATELEPLVKRYILANLPAGPRQSARDTLAVTVLPDLETGFVSIESSAAMGGAVVGRHVWGPLVTNTVAYSGAVRVLAPVDLVLALDVTESMGKSLRREDDLGLTRIEVVREAAIELVGGLYEQTGIPELTSVGLVPFNTTVNVGAARTDWVWDLGLDYKQIPAGFGPWRGCVEMRRNDDDLDLSLDLPTQSDRRYKFGSWFSPSTLQYPKRSQADAEAAAAGTVVVAENDWSADDPPPPEERDRYERSPHFGCPRDEIIPLTTNRETVEQAIRNLRVWYGGGTFGHLGVVWGRRLLADSWRSLWGFDPEDTKRQKVLVLLSDGVNGAYDDVRTYPGRYQYRDRDGVLHREGYYTSYYTGYGRAGRNWYNDGGFKIYQGEHGYNALGRIYDRRNRVSSQLVLNQAFRKSCTAAKEEGIIVFTVSAVPRGHSQEYALQQLLRECASSEEYAFVDDSEPELLRAAFRKIGEIVLGFRRVRVAGVSSTGDG